MNGFRKLNSTLLKMMAQPFRDGSFENGQMFFLKVDFMQSGAGLTEDFLKSLLKLVTRKESCSSRINKSILTKSL